MPHTLQRLEEMKNKILEKRSALVASIDTLNYKINNLKQWYSREQVRCWYINRHQLCEQLKALPTEKQLKEWAADTTALVKQIHVPNRKVK